MFDKILSLAAQLPTGLDDPHAVVKMRRERDELKHHLSINDLVGAKLEAGDVAYYAAKAYHNGLLTFNEALAEVVAVAHAVGLSVMDVLRIAEIKYTLRARPGNPKDDQAERQAIASAGY